RWITCRSVTRAPFWTASPRAVSSVRSFLRLRSRGTSRCLKAGLGLAALRADVRAILPSLEQGPRQAGPGLVNRAQARIAVPFAKERASGFPCMGKRPEALTVTTGPRV